MAVKKIFLVDDDMDDRGIFMDALQEIDSSIELEMAVNGIDALERIQAAHAVLPDYIFMDLNMPLMNGVQCLRELKQTPAVAHIPVVMYSTSSHGKDRDEAARAGASDYIVKPFSFIELCSLIRTVLDGKSNGSTHITVE